MSFFDKYTHSVSRRGVRRSLAAAAGALRRTILGWVGRPVLRPEASDGDAWDARFGVETSEARLSAWTVFLQNFFFGGAPYESPSPELARLVLASIPVAHEQFSFVDLGSGKGRILLLASEYPYKQIVGVEQQRRLHQVATKNLLGWQIPHRVPMRSVHGDARQFTISGPAVFFLNNPFSADVLQRVLENIRISAEADASPKFVIYLYPQFEHIFSTFGFRKVQRSDNFAIYELRATTV